MRGTDLPEIRWFKSSASSTTGGNCVEIAAVDGGVAVRDSKDRGGPALLFSTGEWLAFLAGVRNHEFDL